MSRIGDITRLLRAYEDGESDALDALMSVVYDDLERLASAHLHRQFGDRAGQVTMDPSALVSESFMKLLRQRNAYENREQFFAIATRVMLRVLIDYRRRRQAAKRGGGEAPVSLLVTDPAPGGDAPSSVMDVEALAEVLGRLEELDSRKADVVKLRVVWGLGVDEIAEALQISASSVDRDWRFAKAWLAEEIERWSATKRGE